MRSLLQSKGYDGIVYRNAMEGARDAEGPIGQKLRATHEDLRDQWDAAIDNDTIPEEDLRRLDDRVTQAAKAYDQHMRKVGKDSYIVFNPNQVRSQFAAFDPKQASSGNILKGLMPFAPPAAAAMSRSDDSK